MGLFSKSSSKDIELAYLRKANKTKDRRIRQLENLCREKDSFFNEMISDGLRHGSPLAAKHMSDRKKYLRGK